MKLTQYNWLNWKENSLYTFNNIHHGAACSLLNITITVVSVISKSAADDDIIDHHVEDAIFTSVYQEINGEIVESVSTRRNRKHSSWAVVTAKKISQ